MVTPNHPCPWGIKAKDLLRRNGYVIEDHHLESEVSNASFKQEHRFSETSQIFIEGEHPAVTTNCAQARFLLPVIVSLVTGIHLLVLVPALITILEDFKGLGRPVTDRM